MKEHKAKKKSRTLRDETEVNAYVKDKKKKADMRSTLSAPGSCMITLGSVPHGKRKVTNEAKAYVVKKRLEIVAKAYVEKGTEQVANANARVELAFPIVKEPKAKKKSRVLRDEAKANAHVTDKKSGAVKDCDDGSKYGAGEVVKEPKGIFESAVETARLNAYEAARQSVMEVKCAKIMIGSMFSQVMRGDMRERS